MKDHVLDNVPIDQQSLAHYVDDKDIANPKIFKYKLACAGSPYITSGVELPA